MKNQTFIIWLTCTYESALLWLWEHTAINRQLFLQLWAPKVLCGQQGVSYVHNHSDGHQGGILSWEEGKDVMEDVELWLVWPLLGQEWKVPEAQSI